MRARFCVAERRGLARGSARGIEHLATATGTSVRTLQRRLKDAGVNYSDLQSDVRKTLALNLLENETLALAEIAFSLGYSEVSGVQSRLAALGRPIAGPLSSTTCGSFQIRRSEEVGAARQGIDLNDFARQAANCGLPSAWHFLPSSTAISPARRRPTARSWRRHL
jgi:AraC-like DNA-binding protein